MSRLSNVQIEHILGLSVVGDYRMTLADFLKREEDAIGLVALAQKTGVAHTSLRKLINGDYKREIETFIKIADAYAIPLWKVMEMAEYDLGLSQDEVARRLSSVLDILPEARSIFARLADMDPKDLAAIVVHIDALIEARNRLLTRSE